MYHHQKLQQRVSVGPHMHLAPRSRWLLLPLPLLLLPQGNTHAKRSIQGDEPAEGADSFRVGSPPVSPGSPLTYTPQVAMEPIAHAHARHEHDSSAQRLGTEFVGAAGWPAQPKLVPVEITCECKLQAQQPQGTTTIQQPVLPTAAAASATAARSTSSWKALSC
jgi:hypothetical protein